MLSTMAYADSATLPRGSEGFMKALKPGETGPVGARVRSWVACEVGTGQGTMSNEELRSDPEREAAVLCQGQEQAKGC